MGNQLFEAWLGFGRTQHKKKEIQRLDGPRKSSKGTDFIGDEPFDVDLARDLAPGLRI